MKTQLERIQRNDGQMNKSELEKIRDTKSTWKCRQSIKSEGSIGDGETF